MLDRNKSANAIDAQQIRDSVTLPETTATARVVLHYRLRNDLIALWECGHRISFKADSRVGAAMLQMRLDVLGSMLERMILLLLMMAVHTSPQRR